MEYAIVEFGLPRYSGWLSREGSEHTDRLKETRYHPSYSPREWPRQPGRVDGVMGLAYD